LSAVRRIAVFGRQIIGAGGVYTKQDVDIMLASGAQAVQIDAALWGSNWWHKSVVDNP
jgi:dihydroorotate dehydrogenase